MYNIVGASLSARVHVQNMEQLHVDRLYMTVIRMWLSIEQPLATEYEQNIQATESTDIWIDIDSHMTVMLY